MRGKSTRFKLLLGLAPVAIIVIAGVLLGPALAATGGPTPASTPSQQAVLQQYIDAYVQNQYTPTDQGDAGFYVDQAALKSRLDSNGDGVMLGEGDDAANAPVLVDNLQNLTTLIPGTSFRCLWNSECFDAGAVSDLRTAEDNHKAAGFSSDIIDYCQTDHTAAPTTAGWGFLAQTGALATDSSIPHVYNFKWGRNGWTNTVGTYPDTGPLTTPGTPTVNSLPTPPADSCDSAATAQDLVRCSVNWAINSSLGNVGNGQSPGGTATAPTLNAGHIVDIRDGSSQAIDTTMVNAGVPAVNVPLNKLFNTGLADVPSGASDNVLVTGRSQGPSGLAALGLKMLGYNMATGGYLHGGVPYWNNTLDEKQTSTGNSYALMTVPAQSTFTQVDTTGTACPGDTCAGPIISNPATAPGDTSAHVTWNTNRVATSKVEWGTSPGTYTQSTNNTILHSAHDVNLTGLTPSTTYYYRITSYDALAHGTTAAEGSFQTAGPMNSDDYVYDFPWYDTTGGFSSGTWINMANLGPNAETADIWLQGSFKESVTLQPNENKNVIYYNTIGGMISVRCRHCQASGDHMTVSERSLFNGTFNETVAPEHTENVSGTSQLGTAYAFPWYDNQSTGMIGDWVMVGNADPSSDATVDVYVADMSTPVSTKTIPPRSVDPNPVQIFPRMLGGPVKVVSRNGEKILVTQRVLFNNSFNETFGNKLS